ncbi:hypothetical protein N0V93_007081 [Gnomoniopsis smithogilvyi]|uniref:Uncharacterized protein n=1 Tax=Gnomoniopsis smithogilvyi TaxID=1191159 RepID=A0A9W8YT45_9PEZI|nr:hypothetical protein N0V93_007081 [Gnomoniopsis smithogilvyi]
MTFDNNHLNVDSARGIDNDELFTTPSTDPIPDRHPSVLRPGGHSSPLKHPSALRPGAARHSRTPSPHSTPASPPAHPPRASPSPVAYKAYSPPKPQSPSDELSSEIEGYFTALEVPPLRINKTPELPASPTPPLPPKVHDQEPLSPEQRCASPPVPPKERIPAEQERHAGAPFSSELEAPTERISQEHMVSPVSEPNHDADELEAPPPPYEESQSIPPPPEKIAPSNRSESGSPGRAATGSAAHGGGAMAGAPVNDAVASSSAALAAVTIEEASQTASQEPAGGDHDDIYSAGPPPPLPPRPSPSPVGKGKDPAIPGAFPLPPSQPSPGYKASGAAATSAAGVGGSIAGVGQSASLKQARKALEKGLGHLIDKAKEHHHAREQHSNERKSSGRRKSPDGSKKSVDGSGNVAQVRMMKP